eukprot:1284755-Ditylum_brightwellii.AAC.1
MTRRIVDNGVDSSESHLTHGTGLKKKIGTTRQSVENGVDGGERHLTHGTGLQKKIGTTMR